MLGRIRGSYQTRSNYTTYAKRKAKSAAEESLQG
jgi:hypothetical protein